MDFDLYDTLTEGTFVVIDVEADGQPDQRAIEVSVLRHERGVPVHEDHWLINSGRPILPLVSDMHGIRDADVADAPFIEDIRQDIAAAVSGRVVVAHAIANDLGFLSYGIPELPLLPAVMVDTLRLAKNLVREAKGFSLAKVCGALDIGFDPAVMDTFGCSTTHPGRRRQPHSASVDAYMTGRLAVAMAPRIDLSPKQRRHMNNMAEYRMKAKEKEELLRSLAPIHAGGAGPSV